MSEPKRVRGKPFQKRGDEWSDAARAGAAAAPKPETPVDFDAFAAALLTDPSVRRAMARRFKRGEISAAELRLVTDAASRAPQTTERQREYGEEMARLQRLSKGERKLLYLLTKKMAGEPVESEVVGYAWTLSRRPGAIAGARLPRATIIYERDDEPDLPDTLPLAEASRRLALAPREDEVAEVTVIPTARQALRALPEALQEVKTVRDVHAVDDEQHRAVCRACRQTWRDRG